MVRDEHDDATQPVLQKADFGDIYDQADPRAYFTTLAAYDYRIPHAGAEVFRHILSVGLSNGDRVRTVLDIGCSYGIVPMLLRTDLTMTDVFRHYGGPEVSAMSSEQVAEADRELIDERSSGQRLRILGLDIAANAVRHAVASGSLDAGFVENLEHSDPSPELRDALAGVDLITSTGGVGYMTEKTFRRLIEAAGPRTQVAAFCLRTYDYGPIAAVLAEHGLVTEAMDRTFTQRRFVDSEEQSWAIERVRSLGLDPTGKESDGCYHADFFYSRSAEAATALPVRALSSR